MVKFLVELGADVNAVCTDYGGNEVRVGMWLKDYKVHRPLMLLEVRSFFCQNLVDTKA